MSFPFNVRVYALIINKGRILLSDEQRGDFRFTKFPGGGLEQGEGIKDCIVRELEEEIGIRPASVEHFYTTEFYQQSAFNEDDQIISVYYRVMYDDYDAISIVEEPFDFSVSNPCVRWIALEELDKNHLTLPIDQHVISLLA